LPRVQVFAVERGATADFCGLHDHRVPRRYVVASGDQRNQES
jgi:hypothetical protein